MCTFNITCQCHIFEPADGCGESQINLLGFCFVLCFFFFFFLRRLLGFSLPPMYSAKVEWTWLFTFKAYDKIWELQLWLL